MRRPLEVRVLPLRPAVALIALAPAIVNGQPEGVAASTAALVSGGRVYCSGVLVAPRFVLTAAHCTDPEPRTITLGTARVNVTRVVVHPQYDPPTLGHDLALVELVSAPAVAPSPLARTSAVMAGHDLRVEGYGLAHATDPSPGVLRRGTARVSAVTATHFELAPNPGLPCVGDSGGPVFDNETVVGITSYGDEACADKALVTRVDMERAFIDDVLAHPSPDPAPEASGSGCSVSR